jgi:hypothetical protein
MSGDPLNPPSSHCTQCGAALRANAQFCTACGAPVAAAPSARPQVGQAPSSARGRLWLLIGAAALLLAAVAGFAVLNRDQPPVASAPAAIPTAQGIAQDIPYPEVARVAPEQAHISAMSGQALIVDVRGREYYAQGHARGAISIPLEELPARLDELPKDKAVLFYCT